MQAAHFILFVDHPTRSRDFYRAVLDRPWRLDVPGMTEFDLAAGAVLGLMPRSSLAGLGLPDRRGGSELYLVTPEVEAALARALGAGARLISPLEMRSWGARVAYLLDPDGYVLALADRNV